MPNKALEWMRRTSAALRGKPVGAPLMQIVKKLQMKQKIITIISILFFLNIASAEMTRLVSPIDPLPQELVPVLFERINNNEKIEIHLLHQALNCPQITLRAYTARILGEQGDETSIPYLIDALSDDSLHVGAMYLKPGMNTTRYWVNESLKRLTGEDFGFVWDDSKNTRIESILRWREWYFEKYTD
ncbi:MAG: HEAT repeat domain-containing protein [Proteobacteria bacterium]|nr:HEAT repeat domain-containing protein [Pseudomonadota bacterium]